MCQAILHLLILMTLSCHSLAENETNVTCPDHQRAFGGSCFKFVGIQHSFFSAEAWCEENGGHLAFIPDEDTQYFLQRHMNTKEDMWFGVVASVEGHPSWLDGSPVTYSKWVSSPEHGATCGYILRDSGFHWEATKNCSKKLNFICQFESGRTIVCEGHNTTLQCGSGQVLMIDGGFYGRKSIHYCRSKFSPPTSPQHQCGWVDAVESITAHCQGRQVCQVAEVVNSFAEPCPQLKSYLSVDYHCKDGLILSMNTTAAVFNDVRIQVKWLVHSPLENLSCRVNTGDGHGIYLNNPKGLESSVVHKYTHPSTFIVAAECTSSEMNITAQKIITIQEPVVEICVVKCYAGNLSFYETNCKALYGEAFQIQMEVKAGTNVVYTIKSDEKLLSGLSVVRGTEPQNITVTSEMVKQLGSGCHNLTLYASNMVTFLDVSKGLQVCILEKIVGLQVSVLTESDKCLDSPFIIFGVSLERGDPVLLLFSLTGHNGSFTETRQMNTKKEIFQIEHPVQGSQEVKLRVCNVFSSLEVLLDMSASCGRDLLSKQSGHDDILFGFNKRQKRKYTTTNPQTPKPASGTNTATTTPGIPATAAPSGLSCSILPQSGTVLDAFKITCNTKQPCFNCQYCFKTQGNYLQCSKNNEVKSIFLPLGDSSSNYNLNIMATAKNRQEVLTTTITAQVQDSTLNSNSVGNVVDLLKAQGQLSAETTGQLFSSVANNLNSQSDPSGKADREMLREKMLDTMTEVVKEDPTKSPQEVQVLAGALAPLVKTGAELSTSAQEGAALLFANLSSSLLHMDVNASEENQAEMLTTASIIVEGMSNILDYSSNKKISDAILGALNNIQSALLFFKEPNEEPSIIQQNHISVLVRRVSPTSLHTTSINIPNSSSPAFSLPKLPSTILPSEEPVDVRMLSLDKNPFSWKEGGNISGFIGSLSLTTTDGSGIPVENISEDIEILLPRPAEEQVNTSILYLGNFSTTVIDIPSAESTLVLKMIPSKDPLPFKALLGYNHYPTETNYVAATQMPQQGATQEEKYTWLLHPEDLKGNTGVHYLVVRPIVGPGIKSINASLSITPITTSCKFWNESQLDWSNYGCRVGVNTTRLETQCLCNHLTFFGSSFFVTPNLVDPSRTAELFATFANNPAVVCFVGALFVAYLLVVVWARRKDIQDTAKVKVTVLEDNDPMDEYRYLLSICTGHRIGASTSSQVTVTLLGTEGNSEPHHLTDSKKCLFERGAVDMFLLTTPFSLGNLQGIRLWHNNSGSHPAWYVGNVMVQDLETEQKWHFLCNSWLSVNIDDCSLDKLFPVSSELDLKGFSNLFFMKTTKDFSDGHLWYSVISRPPSSNFTCVQRVSCCFSLLLCTMLTSIMFYGIPKDPSEQTMDLGTFQFTWQQFMIGTESSLIMFPVNFLIVSIFRITRPRETSCCQRKNKKINTQEQASTLQTVSSQTATMNMSPSASLDIIIKDITKIAHSLSKTAKSNVPFKESEVGPGQQNDINAILSVVKDFIKQNNKTSDNIEPKTQPRLSDSRAYVHPASTEGVIQKKSNKTHYLYRQLCHISSELSQLGPSSFPDPHSYNQALQQVQSMKGLLEDQLFTSNSVSPDELNNKMASPSDSTDGDGSQKKRMCCHGGLPWWFVFVGWLLVIATSVICGYFTMLYGLKFGKERSISWLVSMIISFFQSILLIQPLKVLCFAIFFALVIKKVDEEDFQNVPFERNNRNIGDCKNQQVIQQHGGFYEPPLPAHIERMRRNMIMEQKAFALLREILIYMGFLCMLLLVAHGQRDPNAYYLNTHVTQSFCGSIRDSMSVTDIFTWANTSLLTNLFGVYPGFITDGNSKLVGNARLRQLRVQKKSCQTAGIMFKVMPDCNAPYSWEAEDMGSYEPGWNKQVEDNISTSTSSPWKYQTHTQLRAYPIWGKMVLYRGGGFAVELGPDLQNASSTLEYLFSNKWLDMYTRAIFVEFSVYNANVNLFCIVTLLLETTAVGAFQLQSDVQSIHLYPSTGSLRIFVMTAEIICLLFILYYMFIQGKLMKQQRWLYFKNKWNLLDLTIILLSWSAVAVFTKRTLLGNRDITYYQNHKDKFASFYETATADSLLQYLIAFLVLLATIKLWHLLRLNPKMNKMTAALQRALTDITGLLVISVIMLVAYSIACNLIYGWNLSSYKTFVDALITVISLQIGIFNYDEVLDNNLLLGGLLIGSCIVFMTFVVLSLLVSVILEAVNQEKRYHKPSEEDEIVDLLLRKICCVFGIKYKHTKDTQEPDVNGSNDYSRNILNTSTPDVNIFQMSDKYVNP